MTDKEKFIVLCDNDQLKRSDAIILLEGDGKYRASKAIDLFHKDWAELLVFSGGIENFEYGSYPFRVISPILESGGIPNQAIYLEDKSQHTRDQGIEIVKLCIKSNWTSIILIASHYHQYRAFLTFLQVLKEENLERKIKIINAPADNLEWFEITPWGKRFDLLSSEFEKIEKYAQLGHIATFDDAINYFIWKEKQE